MRVILVYSTEVPATPGLYSVQVPNRTDSYSTNYLGTCDSYSVQVQARGVKGCELHVCCHESKITVHCEETNNKRSSYKMYEVISQGGSNVGLLRFLTAQRLLYSFRK
jgi:hypothetical protein